MDASGEFDPVVNINSSKFTDTEKEILLNVVARDEEIRIQEKGKIESLKHELSELREKGVPDGEEQSYGRVCKRCRSPLGLIFNSGALCSNCSAKVCKSCRINTDPTNEELWNCTVCVKIRDIRAESGAWFYDNDSPKKKRKKAYGSFLIKSIFSKAKKRDTIIYKDPEWTDIIEKEEEILPAEEEDRDEGYLLIKPTSNGAYEVEKGNSSFVVSGGEGTTGAQHVSLLSLAHNNDVDHSVSVDDRGEASSGGTNDRREESSGGTKHPNHGEGSGKFDDIVYDPGEDVSTEEDEEDDDGKLQSVQEEEEEKEEGEERTSIELTELQVLMDTPSFENNIHINCLEEESLEKPPFQRKPNVKLDHSQESDLGIDFSKMPKIGSKVTHAQVSHNDLDLKELQTMFLRKEKLTKVKTDEHSDKSESESDSDVDYSDIDIKQVVVARKTSSQEELESLHFHLKTTKTSFNLEEEITLDKSKYVSKEKQEEKTPPEIDTEHFQKIDSLAFVETEQEDDSDGEMSGFTLQHHEERKMKLTKLRTEEHSDGEISDEMESDHDDKAEDDLTELQVLMDTPSFENNKHINCLEEESLEKPPFQRKSNVKLDHSQESDLGIDFSKMPKIGSKVTHAQVSHNDLDLKELQTMFLRKEKLTKVKTDEHSDKSESESDSDVDYSDIDIKQVVVARKTSSQEELESLHFHLKTTKTSFNLEEEITLDKSKYVSKEKQEEKTPPEIDTEHFQKIDSLEFVETEQEDDSDGEMSGFTLQHHEEKKMKLTKLRTEEHSDGEISDEMENDHEKSLPLIQQPTQEATKDEEDIDNIVAEIKANRKDSVESIESIGSNYSVNDDITEQVHVAGEIMVGFKHEGTTFEVQVHRAKDLTAVDTKKNTTDPYVKVYLLPDIKGGGKRKTKPKRQSLNPEFDEILTFEKIEYEDVLSRVCQISVWHYDLYTHNTLLGEVNVNLDQHVASGYSLVEPTAHWYTLAARKVTRKQITFVGELMVNIYYQAPISKVDPNKKVQSKLPDPTKGSLNVSVMKATSLPSPNEDGTLSPFCKITLKNPLITSKKFRTTVCKKTLAPTWEKEYVFNDISWESLKESILQISVWAYERGSQHGFLGVTRLGLGLLEGHDSFGEEVQVWQDVLDQPNKPQEYTVPLRSSLDSVKEDVYAPPVPYKIIPEKEHEENIKKKPFRQSLLSSKNSLQADTISLASSGSMLSIYSSQGAEVDNLVITGEILFALKYDEPSAIFSVTIEKAKDIAAANPKQQISDPYVKIYLLPDKTKTSKKKTSHRRKTLNPQWNETLKYKTTREELLQKTLQVSIWNHDRFGRNVFLGEVQVNMKHYASKNSLETNESVWYTLQEMALVSVGATNENKGELKVALKYENNVLTFIAKEAVGLPQVDPEKPINPFVRCYVLPDRSRKSKRKTSVKKKTRNPVWNERLDFPNISDEELHARVLEVTVWDHDSKGHQFLAGMRLGLMEGDQYWHDCMDKEVTIWTSMMQHLGIFAEYTIPLRGTMASRKEELPSTNIPMITQEENLPQFYDKLLLLTEPLIRIALQYVTPEAQMIAEEKKGNTKKKPMKGLLKVHLKEGRHLPTRADGDIPSTFCKAFMYPKKKNKKFKTNTYLKSVEPNWDNGMSFENVSLDELTGRCLEVVVYDEISEKQVEELGSIRLGSGGYTEKWDDSTGREVELWNSMLNNPDKWVSMAVPLRKIVPRDPKEIPQEEEEEEEKKKRKSEKKKEIEILIEDDDLEEDEDKHKEDRGSESPRTAALRAMGIHANSIVENMQKDQPVFIYEPPNDPLTSITEENETEMSTSPKQPLPEIFVNDVKPGDPPFPGAGDSFAQDQEANPRKAAPNMSLLKRTMSETSLTSIYSTDSANIYGQVPIRGEVQFGMRFDFVNNKFELHVFKGRDLAAIDTKKETSDPYCKVYLLPDKTKKGKKKTKTRKKTLNPEWEEILDFKISLRDLRTRTLWLCVWHQEKLGRNIFLGEVMIPMDALVDQGELETPVPRFYSLCEKAAPPMTDLFKGELRIALMYEDTSLYNEQEKKYNEQQESKKKKKKGKAKASGRLNIHIKDGADLPAADRDGFSDPFCKCYLLPLKTSKTKRKTPVIRHTCNPIWDYQTQYDLDYEDLADFGIEFSVWDWDLGKGNDFLGCSRINLGGHQSDWDDAVGVEILAWQHLIEEPNKWKDFTLPLRSSLDTRKKNKF